VNLLGSQERGGRTEKPPHAKESVAEKGIFAKERGRCKMLQKLSKMHSVGACKKKKGNKKVRTGGVP